MSKPTTTSWNLGQLRRTQQAKVTYFLRSSDATEKDWDDVPDDIKNTFDRLGIPEAEQKWRGHAQYESEAVYHSIREGKPRACCSWTWTAVSRNTPKS